MEYNAIDATSQKGLVDELVEGRDLTKQLYSILLKESSSSSTNEAHSLNVTQKILSKIERSLTLLRYEPMGTIDSPLSFSGTPKSPDSEGDSKDQVDCKEARKRKVVPRCTLKVEGCRKSGLESPIDDGFSWRKYGQKDILGAEYPRAYFRCIQRSQGCFATKQVQRSDNNPTYFDVTYRGTHTCYQASNPSSSTPNLTPKPEPIDTMPRPQTQEILWSFQTESKRINHITTNNNTISSSFPPHFSSNYLCSTQNTSPQNYNNSYNHDANIYPPKVRNDNHNDNYQHTNDREGDSSLVSNSLGITSDFSFDQGDLDHDLIFDKSHLFR